ncbi:MAG TPA: lysylphosphatidylglycerol synthase transmembrane domain-containing protein [Ktedonobacteraceae bacterium]|nr:lysylphosphatidylglycerol synthase transmembrane domain-containing protein [Ktedonobacteraceae bacterium]
MITNNSHDSNEDSSSDDNELDVVAKNTIAFAEKEHLIPEIEDAAAPEEITRDQLSLTKRLLNWRTIVPLVVVIIVLAFAVKSANIDPAKTWQAMRSANLLFLLAGFVIYYLSFPIRAVRWRILLQNVGYTKENGVELPGFWKMTEIIYISWFANVVVPFKLGDLYRAYLLHQETDVSTTRSFGTVIAERLLDLIVLLILFIAAIIVSLKENLPPRIQLSLEILLGAVIVGVIGLFVLRIFREQIARLVPARFRDQYYHFQEGTLGSFRRLPTLTLLTVATWFCESMRFFFVALALNLIGGDMLHIVAAGFFIGLGEALLTAIPATGGGIGLVELGLVPMVIFVAGHTSNITNLASASVLLDRTISYASILVLGFIVFLVAFGRNAGREKKTKKPA